MTAPTAEEAEATLAGAGEARTSLAARGRWLPTYLLVFAAATIPVMLLIGLDGRRGALVAMTLWTLLVAVMSSWGARRRVILRGHRRRSLLAFGGWGVLYGVAILVGTTAFKGEPAFWIPAAVLTTIPLVLGACWPVDAVRDRRGSTSTP